MALNFSPEAETSNGVNASLHEAFDPNAGQNICSAVQSVENFSPATRRRQQRHLVSCVDSTSYWLLVVLEVPWAWHYEHQKTRAVATWCAGMIMYFDEVKKFFFFAAAAAAGDRCVFLFGWEYDYFTLLCLLHVVVVVGPNSNTSSSHYNSSDFLPGPGPVLSGDESIFFHLHTTFRKYRINL